MRAAAVLAVAGALAALPAPALAGEWLAGDLHVHTQYSHDVWAGPQDDNTGLDEAYTLGFPVGGQFLLARSRGLDYLAITDHDDIRSQSDRGFGAGGVIPIPGYESSLRGHAGMLGATRLYDRGDRSAATVQALADALRSDGGVFQANHPIDPPWEYGYEVRPDTVEVWNISRLGQPPVPATTDNDAAVRYWEGWLDRGEHVGATGGSDSHWVSTSQVQGVGQPTTWVYAEDRTRAAILEGIRRGHTFISWQPPALGGPRVFLESEGGSIVGDLAPAGTALKVRVVGAPGARLKLVFGGAGDPRSVVVPSPDFVYRVRAPSSARWVRAEVYMEDLQDARQRLCDPLLGKGTTYCRNRILILAMTSALYLQPWRETGAD